MKKAPSSVITSYKRRQQMGPFILWGLVVVLVLAGLIFLIVWLARPNSPMMALFASATPTSTSTATATSTSTLTLTPTETVTSTVTVTPTASKPFDYTVEEGDYLSTIAEKFGLGIDGVEKILALNVPTATDSGIDPVTQTIFVGQVIHIPNPGYELPTATAIPTNLARGTEVSYTIRPGDTLQGIASLFNSTVDDIKKTNDIVTDNSIQAGQVIKVHANLVTPTPARAPTITPGASPTPPSPFTQAAPNNNDVTVTPTLTLTP